MRQGNTRRRLPGALLSVGFTPQSLHNCRQQAKCLSYIIGPVEMMGQDVSQAVFARQVWSMSSCEIRCPASRHGLRTQCCLYFKRINLKGRA
jgi:hypothetical protein